MSKQDRQKLSILVVLLGVLGLTISLGYRMIRPPTAASIQPADTQPKTSANPPAASEAHIRMDLLKDTQAGKDIGTRNLFQYQQAPPPPPPPPHRGGPPPNPTPSVPIITTPSGPPKPPPPPPIALKYQGYAVTSTPNPELIAFIADDSRHYNVKTGEILMGRFRIVSISDKTVEVEDLEFNRRQTLPLLK